MNKVTIRTLVQQSLLFCSFCLSQVAITPVLSKQGGSITAANQLQGDGTVENDGLSFPKKFVKPPDQEEKCSHPIYIPQNCNYFFDCFQHGKGGNVSMWCNFTETLNIIWGAWHIQKTFLLLHFCLTSL